MKVFLLAGLFILSSLYASPADVATKEVRRTAEYREALASGAIASLQVSVVDDVGAAVSNVNVTAVFDMTTYEVVAQGWTDVRGKVVLAGKTRGNAIKIRAIKEGCYLSEKTLCLVGPEHAHPVKNGKWQPSLISVHVPIRKITCPARLVCVNKMIHVPGTNAWYGFDMKVGDFVSPFGTGTEADFQCFVDWDGRPAWNSQKCVANFKFSGIFSGGMYVENVQESEFKTPYNASGIKLETESLTLVDRDGDPHTTGVPFRKDASFVLRSRCVLDDQGRIKSANYGCIKNLAIGPSRRGLAILCLDYIYNPISNDLNLEPIRQLER